MAGLIPGDPALHGMAESGPYGVSQEKTEEGGRWYLSRKEIEENSPSRRDGIDLKKETYLRKSYCTFLQDLGMRLKVPQVTIATAIIFCHRFFLRQSHMKNDRRTVATVCMFLAGKVEETPRPLKDVILVSYEIINKKDPAAVQRIKQKEVYEQQKELILIGERVVLTTLGFDLNVHHPYKPLVEAIKKFKVAQNALAQVAWNFVNDGLRTSLCLQFKPHHIAAGAIFLAAKFLKVKLPSDGEKVWWQEFDVTPRQLEEVSNQMLELYEQNRLPASQGSEVEASAGGVTTRAKTPAPNEQTLSANGKPGASSTSATRASSDGGGPGPTHRLPAQNRTNDPLPDGESESRYLDPSLPRENEGETSYRSKAEPPAIDVGEWKATQSPVDAIKRIDKDKVKAALEKRKKSRGDVARKMDLMDDDDLIERELEDGIELAAENDKTKNDRRQSWSKFSNRVEEKENGELGGDEKYRSGPDAENVEEGEMSLSDDGAPRLARSPPELSNRKRKMVSPEKLRHDYHEIEGGGGGSKNSRHGYSDRGDHKKHRQENHV
ncbi:Cyclin-T1-3 [Ranunculus cassubicifolius]